MAYKITHDASLSPTSARTKLHFLEAFYSTSDTESKHEEYVSSFTPDATLVMGSKVANGTDEIRTLRHGLWTHVASRKHAPEKAYFAGENELMLYGTVKYVLKTDSAREVEVPWAGRVVFEDGDGGRMRFYQVYLDPSAQSGRK